jgi:mutator protein MutT
MIKVTAGIIPREGKYLIAQRMDPPELDGMWEFPGGKIKPHETHQKCLERELWEEGGIEVIIWDFFEKSVYHYPFGTIELSAYWAELISGEFKSEVHYDSKWVYPIEMRNFVFCPADVPFVEKLGNLKFLL